MTTPSSLRPAMPSSSSTTLSTSDHRQSARNRHANASSRRTSSPVGYRSSSAAILGVPGVFRTRNLPQFCFVIESKMFQPRDGRGWTRINSLNGLVGRGPVYPTIQLSMHPTHHCPMILKYPAVFVMGTLDILQARGHDAAPRTRRQCARCIAPRTAVYPRSS